MNKKAIFFVGAVLSLVAGGAQAAYALNLHAPVTEIARQIYNLHMLIVYVCFAIFVVVFSIMFYSLYKHRKSVGHEAAQFHEHHVLEIIWTIIPAVILIAMAIPATRTILAMKDTSAADMTVKVTGHQWKWEYDYIGKDVKFISNLSTTQDQIDGKSEKGENYLLEVDNPMVVPVGKKVRVLLTAEDVIHSWSVPSFGVKQDAIPGFIRDTWFKAEQLGTYRGNCAELCGKEHGFMPIVVKVVSDTDYTKWVDGKKKELAAKQDDPNKVWSKEDLMKRGAEVYAKTGACVACHQADGKGNAGAGILPLAGSKFANTSKENVIAILLNGRKNSAMNSFATQLNDIEIAAVTTYVRNTWGNAATDFAAPADVKAARAWDAAKVVTLTAKAN